MVDAPRSGAPRNISGQNVEEIITKALDAFVEMSRRRDMRSEDQLNQALRLHYLNLQSTLRRVAASQFQLIDGQAWRRIGAFFSTNLSSLRVVTALGQVEAVKNGHLGGDRVVLGEKVRAFPIGMATFSPMYVKTIRSANALGRGV
jgi:hypothetical protein